MAQKRILLIIGGGIAAYKSLFLIRELAGRGIKSRVIITKGGTQFVTPLSAASLSGDTVYTDLWDLTAEAEMGHIELSRSADLIVVAPATADIMAKATQGIAGDLATTTLLATDKPVLYAPAMNVRMYEHPATQRNMAQLKSDGALFVGPDAGEMACGEFGEGRMAEPAAIADAIEAALNAAPRPLTGRRVVITAGPTREPIDPVRYLSNHSSGKQGYAIAEALEELGAHVTLISGPTALQTPDGVTRVDIETAQQMMDAVERALPADIFLGVAAVADWRPAQNGKVKIKKSGGGASDLKLVENPDILKSVCDHVKRPELVIGFAAETNDVLDHAKAKLARKGCDWIMANDVSGDVMGGDHNTMIWVTKDATEMWPKMRKADAAHRLSKKIAEYFE
ncbi:bifunctional phosphopantothenoylcysteine decarboxylase/phosphopantothenate--cysteine ligase CoaBC [Robiginitomaculum antarcticum]|uniref:bifunctional phosphopantothenoylcysteine decarboxylase/phosphopantothenate--cysteine ligase CoaBC n=1 Tax=Robiginitomaculum antarcticum TaxID=437507 RepID=UPI0003613F5B